MTLIQLIIAIALVGVILWAVNSYVPMDEKIKKILNVAVVIFLIIYLIQAFGLLGPMQGIRIN